MHLAKRFYDMSIDSSEDAYVPVTMALLKLSTKFFVEAALKGTLLVSIGITTSCIYLRGCSELLGRSKTMHIYYYQCCWFFL